MLLLLPETKGKTLLEIQQLLAARQPTPTELARPIAADTAHDAYEPPSALDNAASLFRSKQRTSSALILSS